MSFRSEFASEESITITVEIPRRSFLTSLGMTNDFYRNAKVKNYTLIIYKNNRGFFL